MRLQHITDTHGRHGEIVIQEDIDVLIFSGDESNYRDISMNKDEFEDFFEWWKKIDVPYKLFIPGNHSSYIYNNNSTTRKLFKTNDCIYLDKDEVTIEGIKFYGEPITPRYGNWSFMIDRDSMDKHWDQVPKDVNVLITHGPPYGILDASENPYGGIDLCGCKNLRKRIDNQEWTDLQVVAFGHIHRMELINPPGLFYKDNVVFSNAAAIEDRKFESCPIFNGNIIDI